MTTSLATAQSRSLGDILFREAWILLAKDDRCADDDARLIRLASSARLRWSSSGTTRNRAVAEWLLARAHADCGDADLAVEHARACLHHAAGTGLTRALVGGGFEGVALRLERRGFRGPAAKIRQLASFDTGPAGAPVPATPAAGRRTTRPADHAEGRA